MMHELHLRPGGVSFRELEGVLGGVSARTVRRYVAFCREELRDRRGRPLLETAESAGRRCLRLATYGQVPEAGKYDILALYFALTLVRVLEGTVFRESGERLWQQLRKALPPVRQIRLADLDRKFYSIPYAVKDYRRHDERLDVVVQCLFEQRRMRIAYGDPPRPHEVEPYTLAEYRGGLYLLAHSSRARKILYFAVERIADAERLPERFVYPSGYSPAKQTEGTFGIIDGEETRVDLRIRNDETLRFLRARRIHPTQRFRRGPDGTTHLTMRVRGTTELANWVLSHTPYIQVLRPRALREEVAARLREAAALY